MALVIPMGTDEKASKTIHIRDIGTVPTCHTFLWLFTWHEVII